ncbi:CLUMA_CG018233, isoform A [Clunio marinus]|uniref:CLUMA_CG018233, isoform A n=1 Tax=Clunio marinus TaxID=568069 RepID=A0A1J1J0Y1_9DIPT|nr:CLUMA_CG018233, isoform A [Clunio marinus]
MVLLHIKRGESSQFLYETSVGFDVGKSTQEIVTIYNGCLKIRRIAAGNRRAINYFTQVSNFSSLSEIEELANYGCMLPPEIMGLTDEQVEELKLVDSYAETCIPSGGFNQTKDPVGRRNGRQPLPNMQEILRNSIKEAVAMVDKKLIDENKILTQKQVKEALDLLRGAVTIVYPMNLPPHDSIRNEFQNTEDLSGTQASLEVIEPAKAQLWFAGKQMLPNHRLADFIGKNEKCKVIVKLQKSGEGAPAREPVFTEAERKQMMMHAYRRQEELKRLENDDDDNYLNSSWSNNKSLKSQMHGIDNIKFRAGK